MGTTDIFLLVILATTLLVGFFWGAVRSLMLLAAWLLAFLAGAYLKLELGSYLASQWANYDASFSEMAAFGMIFLGALAAAPILIVIITRSNQRVTRFQVLDDTVGAAFALFVAILGIAGLMIILSTYYGTGDFTVDAGGGPLWTADVYQSLQASNIGSSIQEQLVPILNTVLGPILPADLREALD